MLSKPFFSVIIPVYNKEPHIARAIKSVLNQTFQDFEIIVVCDPSTDNSNFEVKKFKDSRIRVYFRDKPGPGGYAARNLGIKNSKSNWIAFIDADDEWSANHLASLYALQASDKSLKILSSGWCINIDNFSYECSALKAYPQRKTFNYQEYLTDDCKGLSPMWTSSICIDRDTLIECGMFPDGKITMGGDVDTWVRCVANVDCLGWTGISTATYFRDSVNMVTKNSIIEPDLHIETSAILLTYNNNKLIKRLIKRRANKYIRIAWNNNLRNRMRPFDIGKYLYFDVEPAIFCVYATLNAIPYPVQYYLRFSYDFLKRIIGKIFR